MPNGIVTKKPATAPRCTSSRIGIAVVSRAARSIRPVWEIAAYEQIFRTSVSTHASDAATPAVTTPTTAIASEAPGATSKTNERRTTR